MRIVAVMWSVAMFLPTQIAAQAPKPNYYRWDSLTSKSIADVVPSYAGRWFDSKRALHASLVNLSDSSRLRAVLDSHEPIGSAGDPRWRPKKGVIMEKAKYTYIQLDHWRNKIAQKAIGAKDFGGIGLRDNENRVRVVVRKNKTIEKVRRLVKSLGSSRQGSCHRGFRRARLPLGVEAAGISSRSINRRGRRERRTIIHLLDVEVNAFRLSRRLRRPRR